jgi:hypothetical protein
VVTWGFVPELQLPAVLLIRELGFEWIWFDGNRTAARRVFIARGTVSVHALDIQMAAIDRHIDLAKLQPRMLDTFDSMGNFRPIDEICNELLSSAS